MDILRVQFGKRFRAARKRIDGLTQEKLAEKLGVSEPTVSRWETGKDFPEDHRLPDICKHLEVTQSYFEGPGDAIQGNPKLSDLAGKQDKILALLERQEAASNEHSEEIQHLIQCWKDAPDERNRAVFLYFLTGDDRELDRAGKAFRKEAAAYFRHLGLKKTKGRASSL